MLKRALLCATALGAACSLVFAQAGPAKRLPVIVWRDAAPGRAVEFCLPLAMGELADVNALRVVSDKGQELPLQARVLSTWPKAPSNVEGPQDRSLRVVWLSVIPGKQAFDVEYGAGVARHAAATSLAVDKQPDGVVVTTGPLRFRVSSKELKPLDQVWLDANGDGKFADDEAMLSAPGSTPVLTTLDGKRYVPAGAVEVAVEDSGPLYATVCVRGELVPEEKKDAAPEERFQVTYRLTAWAGSPAVSLQCVLNRWGRKFLLDPPPNDEEQRREWALLVPVKSYGLDLSLKPAGKVDYAAGGDAKALDRGTLEGGKGRFLLASGDLKTNAPNVRFDVDAKPELKGALRWLDVSSGPAGVGIAIRDAAELFPKGYEVSASGKVTLDLWHDDPPRAALEIGSGFHRSHDIILDFHQGGADAANGERAAALTKPARAAVPAEQFRTSGVFGLMPKSLDSFPELPGVLEKLRMPLPVAYGDYLYGCPYKRASDEVGRVHQNSGMAGNPDMVYGELFAAFGKAEYLDAVDGMGRWMRDWYAKHRLLSDGRPVSEYPEPSNTLVLIWQAPISAAQRAKAVPSTTQFNETFKKKPRRLGCIGLTQDCRVNPCFVKGIATEGMLYHYYLTGDPESLAAARGWADFYLEALTNPHWYGNPQSWIYKGSNVNASTRNAGDRHRFHLLGPWMSHMAFFYEGLGDQKYLDGMKSTMTSIMKGAQEDFPDDDYIFSRTWIVNAGWVPRGNQRFAHATFDYLRLTKDESVKPFASKLADYMIKNYWDDKKAGFFFRPAKPRDMTKGWTPLTRDMTDADEAHKVYLGLPDWTSASALVWCYQTTGDEKYVDVARKIYERIVAEVSAGKIERKGDGWTCSTDAMMENAWNLFYVFEQVKAKKP